MESASSPVFIRQTVDIHGGFKWGTNQPAIHQAYTDTLYLLGLAHGHWRIDSKELDSPDVKHDPEGINIGLAIVVPAVHILEVINNEELTSMRRKVKEEDASKEQQSTMDSAEEPTFTKRQFEDALKKASRKIEPKKK